MTRMRPKTIVLAIGGSIVPVDIQGICDRLQVLLEQDGPDLVVCDVSALIDPDLVAVDALARLQLNARRSRCQVQVLHACDRLQELLKLTGLTEVVPLTEACLVLEPGRQAEQGEQPRSIEEEADAGDTVA